MKQQVRETAAHLVSLFLVAWVLLAGATRATAHALLVRSVPEANSELSQPPPAIDMWFSEALEPGFSKARVLNSRSEEIEAGAITFDPADETHMTLPLGQLEPGIYTVAWQTLSKIDGHEWYGSFPFTVLNPDGSRPSGQAAQAALGSRGDLPTPGETLARWLILLGAMLFLSAPLLRETIVPEVGSWSKKQKGGTDQALIRDTLLWMVYLGFLCLTAGGLLQMALQTFRLGDLAVLPRLLLQTRIGVLVLVRQALVFAGLLAITTALPQPARIRPYGSRLALVGLVGGATSVALLLVGALASDSLPVAIVTLGIAVAGMALAWGPTEKGEQGKVGRWSWRALILLAAALLLSLSINSHAGAGPGSVWAVLGDYIHLLAASVWVGGLILLPVLIWGWRHLPKAPERQPFLATLLMRFSYLAGFSVFILMLTGIFNSLIEVPALYNLWDTSYGRILLLKLALVAIALAVAFVNNRLVHDGKQLSRQTKRLAQINRTVGLEAIIVLVLMLSVAVLVQTPAPRGLPQAQAAFRPKLPYNTIVSGDDLSVHVQIAPNEVGKNRFWVHLYHSDGSAIGEVQLVRLFFEHQEEQLGRAQADLEPLGDGTFQVEGAWLNQAGDWQLSAYIRRRGMDDVLTDVTFTVPPTENQAMDAGLWESPIPGVPLRFLVGIALLALSLVPLGWRQPLRQWQPNRWPAMAGATGLLTVAGLLLIGFSTPELLARSASEPVPASPGSIATGAQVYQENCVICHGVGGLGDGPRAMSLNPPPASFRIHIPLHDDRELYGFISMGIPNTAMPEFGTGFSDEEIWHLVNYLRSEFGSGSSERAAISPTVTPADISDSGMLNPAPLVDTVPFPGVGGRLVFDSPDGKLWVMPVEGGSQRHLFLDLLEKGFAFQPAWSPDGRQVAYGYIAPPDPDGEQAWRGANIWIANADGTQPHALTSQPDDSSESYRDPAWSPDGKFIWATVEIPKRDEENNWVGIESQIRKISLDTGKAEVVVKNAYSPTVAPDGEKLAYLVTDSETYRTSLMMASTTSANVETIVDGSMFDFIFAPRFSPDGKGLAFAAVGEPARSFAPGFISTLGVPGRGLAGLFTPSPVLAHGLPPADVWLINVDGTHLTRLTRLYEDNPTPAWSADGRYIAFGGARGVYLLEVESRKTVRISGQPVDGRLDWSHQ